jgi:hypothetical protein
MHVPKIHTPTNKLLQIASSKYKEYAINVFIFLHFLHSYALYSDLYYLRLIYMYGLNTQLLQQFYSSSKKSQYHI